MEVDVYKFNKVPDISKLSVEEIHKIKDKIDWKFVLSNQKFSIDVLRTFSDVFDVKDEYGTDLWRIISRFQKIDLKFIKDFEEKIWSNEIIAYQKNLSSDYIEGVYKIKPMKNFWYFANKYQKLSPEIKEKYQKLIYKLPKMRLFSFA